MVARRELLTRSSAAVVAVVTAQIMGDYARAALAESEWGVVRANAADTLRVSLVSGAEVELRVGRIDGRTRRDGTPGLAEFRVGDEVVLEVRGNTALLWMQSSYRAFRGELRSVGARLVTTGGSARVDTRTRFGRRGGPLSATALQPSQRVTVNALRDPETGELIARSITLED